MATYDEPGRGRKKCSQCGKYVGVRCSVCENCNAPFGAANPPAEKPVKKPTSPVPEAPVVAKKPSKEPVAQPKAVVMATHNSTVLTPSGRCPVRLEGTSPEIVLEWKSRVVASYPAKLSTTAIIYFVRQFYEYETPEYKEIASIIRSNP